MSDKITLVLADDHLLVRNGIKSLLEDEADMKVVGEAADGEEALRRAAESGPDIVILDIRMPGMNGIEAARRLREYAPRSRALMLSMHESEEYVMKSIEAGACGYLLKDASKEEFLKAIHTVYEGGKYFSGDISEIIVKNYLNKGSSAAAHSPEKPAAAPNVKLTRREREILDLILQGLNNQEIADRLGKSRRTVESHRFNMMKKLDAKNLVDLSNKARELGLAG